MKNSSLVRSVLCGAIAALLLTFTAFADTPAKRSTRPAPVSQTPSAPLPPLGVSLLDQPGGVKVVAVTPGSLAASAGIQPGDVIVRCNGQTVTSASVFSSLVQTRSTTAPFEFELSRGRSTVTVSIPPPTGVVANSAAGGRGTTTAGNTDRQKLRISRMRGGVASSGSVVRGEVVDPFKIPGLDARTQSADGINVLQRVFLDPASGELVFIGRQDKAYATGAIDYSTLLNDALHSPSPVFSLEPTPSTKSAIAGFVGDLDQQMAANLRSTESGKAWLVGIFDQLLSNPSLEVDRRRFLAKGAEIFNVKPEEVPALMQAMLGRTETGSPPWVNFWVKFYQHLGAPEAAEFIRSAANKQNDPDAFRASLDWLGMTPVMADLRSRIASGSITTKAGENILEVEIWIAIDQHCKIPENRWRPAADRAKQTGDIESFQAFNNDLNADIIREYAMAPWLNGLVFSEDFLRTMNRMPQLEIVPQYRNGLEPNSELARTFLAADWMLKTLAVSPELAARVPGHLTPTQFAFQRETAQNMYDLGNVEARLWLTPESVEIQQDSTGTILNFGEARTSVRAEVLEHRGGSAVAEQLIRDSMTAYGQEVTRRYDEYARALPELHQLREAAKILALVHWAQAHGVKLVPPGPVAAPHALPASFHQGFWTAFFLCNSERNFFGLAADGGVDFSPEVGTYWLKTSEDKALGSTALQQLAGSAALGQQAAEAARNGDLETARDLADKSARAMTGDFNTSALPELGKIPEVPPPTRVAMVELQNELVVQNTRAITGLSQPASGPAAETQRAQTIEHLQQIQNMLGSETPAPAQAKHWVKLLRNGDWASLPQPVAPHATPVATAPAPKPTAPVKVVVDPEERARIRDEITQLRMELCRAQSQMRRFNATIQMDQDQRAQWEKITNEAFDRALDRAKEKLADFTVDFPEGKLNDALEKATDPAERARIERALRMVQHLKESYNLKDFASWAKHEDYGKAEVMEGIGIIVDIIGVEDTIKEHLTKRWGLGRVIAFQEAASDLVDSAYDVTCEVVSWRQLNMLNHNSDEFLVAVNKSGERMRTVVAAIHEREIRLGLAPGDTKDPCL